MFRPLLVCALLGAVVGRANLKYSPSHQLAFDNSVDDFGHRQSPGPSNVDLLGSMLDVLGTMQDEYFATWLGTWPTTIDWTAAVMGTHVSGALSSISRALDLIPMTAQVGDRNKENLVTLFFSQVLGYYFGQDHFAIRNEAYDDILWVVLGWLETIQFIDLHTTLNFPGASVMNAQGFQEWHGNIWIPAFAHRTRIFWNLAKPGWDTELCGGGMTWNPRLEPYKNAITNELFISASSSMYLYFPGDWNHAPFFSGLDTPSSEDLLNSSGQDVFRPRDPIFVAFALDGYEWLTSSGMMNNKGLYTDGFHISGYKNPMNPNTKCDVRNEQVYTYNQGVILTGQVNLWKITGNYSYVEDGHRLIRSVIDATGWDLKNQQPADRGVPYKTEDGQGGDRPWQGSKLPHWHGLGRAGVIEEVCDSMGTCSQDAQTFKGIFFHHLTTFCASSVSQNEFVTVNADTPTQVQTHRKACRSYISWLRHNTAAMMRARDQEGRIGMWWTAGLLGLGNTLPREEDGSEMMDPNAVDYRNDGVPNDPLWKRTPTGVTPPQIPIPGVKGDEYNVPATMKTPRNTLPDDEEDAGKEDEEDKGEDEDEGYGETDERDLNDRGRGRTVETQGSGLALLRAYWEISA